MRILYDPTISFYVKSVLMIIGVRSFVKKLEQPDANCHILQSLQSGHDLHVINYARDQVFIFSYYNVLDLFRSGA